MPEMKAILCQRKSNEDKMISVQFLSMVAVDGPYYARGKVTKTK